MDDPAATEANSQPERPPAPPATRVTPATPSPPPRWTGGRIAMIVGGAVLTLIAVVALTCGAYGLWLHTTQRSEGYVMTSSEPFATDGYALATRTLDVSSDVPSVLYGRDWLGDVRIRGESANPDRSLFIGIAHKADVDRYLANVAHTDVVDVSGDPFGTAYRPTYRSYPGGGPATSPGRARFWAASAEGRGVQSLTWSVRPGRWAVVVMRPDGSRGVSANLAAGAKLPALLWASIGLLVFGILMLGAAFALIYLGTREPRTPVRRPEAPAGLQNR